MAVTTLLVWEVLARTRRMHRATPPPWLIGLFCVFSVLALSVGGGFHIENGVPSSILLISVSGLFLLSLWADSAHG